MPFRAGAVGSFDKGAAGLDENEGDGLTGQLNDPPEILGFAGEDRDLAVRRLQYGADVGVRCRNAAGQHLPGHVGRRDVVARSRERSIVTRAPDLHGQHPREHPPHLGDVVVGEHDLPCLPAEPLG